MSYSIRVLYILFLALSVMAGAPSFGQNKKEKKKKKKTTEQSRQPSLEEKAENEYIFIKAESFFIQEKYTDALKLYEQATQKAPQSAGIQFKISRTQFLLRQYEKSLESAQKAIELKDDEKEYYINCLEILLALRRLKETEAVFDNMFLKCKGVYEYHEQAARVYEEIAKEQGNKVVIYNKIPNSNAQKNVSEAEDNFKIYLRKSIQEYNELEKIMGIDENIISKKQQHYLKLNDVEGALKESDKLIEAYPNNPDYVITKCEIYNFNNQIDEAIVFLEDIISKREINISYLVVLSNFYRTVGREKDAETTLNKVFDSKEFSMDQKIMFISHLLQTPNDTNITLAEKLTLKTIAMYPDKPQPYSVAGDVYLIQKEKNKARENYLISTQKDSSKALIWQQIIAIDIDLNQHDSLIKDAKKALQYHPENPLIWFYQGISYQILKKDSLAVNSFEKGLPYCNYNYELLEQYYAQMGDVYYNIKNKEKSFLNYEEALTINPNNIHVLNNYAYFLSIENQDLHKAKSMIKKALRMQPDEATYIDTYAWILYKLNDFEEAKNQLEIALKSTQDGTIIEHYGDVLFKLNKIDEAVEQWKKAAESSGTSDLIKKKISDRKLYEK